MSFQSQRERQLAKSASSGRYLAWGLGLLLVLLLAGASAGWFARKPVARTLIANWCEARDLTCEMDIAHLGTDRVEIHNIRISGPTIPDLLSAREVTAIVDWPGLFTPVFSRVDLTEPAIRAAFDGERLTLDGLEKLTTSSRNSQGDMPIPIINTTGGQIQVDTPAGPLTGQFSTSGRWPDNGHADLAFASTELVSGSDHLKLEAGALSLRREGEALTGLIDLQISSLHLNQTRATDLRIHGELSDQAEPILAWDISVEQLENPNHGHLLGAVSSGQAVLKTSDFSTRHTLDEILRDIQASATANQLRWQAYRAENVKLAGQGETTSDARLDLTASLELSAADSPILSAGALSLDLDGRISPQSGAFSGQGNLFLAAASLAEPTRQAQLGKVRAAAPFDHHADRLRAALDTGLTDFSGEAQFRLDLGEDGDWQVIVPERLALNTASGGAIVMTAAPGRSALTLEPHLVTLAGVLTLSGGQLPRLNADITQMQLAGNQWDLQVGGVKLSRWAANGLALSADLNRLSLQSQGDGLRLAGLGELRFDGRLLGINTSQARIFGGIEAAEGPSGWRIQTVERACLGLAAASASASDTLVVRDIALNICPENGRFIQQEDGLASGTIQLGDFALPFTGKQVSGTAGFEQAEINWTADETLAVSITADQLHLPMQIGTRDLRLETGDPRLGIEFGTVTRLNALLEETRLSGGLVPANVAIEGADFSGTLAANQFRARANARNVDLTDYRDDPLYNPLRAQFTAEFAGPDLTLSGPVNLKETGQKIATADLTLNLLTLDGAAQVRSEDLVFSRGGLQPKHLSDLVRGLLSNGRGRLNAVTDFTIRSGQIAGTGLFTATEFGFDTQKIGAIDGINGEIRFSDMIGLTTFPSQKLTFAHINPGIPLENGELSLQLVAGERLLIEGATWPLAGGTIALQPTEWTIAGRTEELMIDATAIELAELVDVLSLPDMKAEGTISGTFPLTLEGGNVWVRNAFFLADSKGGTLSYTGTAAAQAGLADDRVDAAFTALRNLKFKVLEVGVDGNLIDDITVSARLLGHNPEVYGGAEFDFRISVESKLAQLIRSGQRLAAARWIADAVAVDPDAETDDPFN